MSVSIDQSKLRHRQHDNFTRPGAETVKIIWCISQIAYAYTISQGILQIGLQFLKDFNRDQTAQVSLHGHLQHPRCFAAISPLHQTLGLLGRIIFAGLPRQSCTSVMVRPAKEMRASANAKGNARAVT